MLRFSYPLSNALRFRDFVRPAPPSGCSRRVAALTWQQVVSASRVWLIPSRRRPRQDHFSPKTFVRRPGAFRLFKARGMINRADPVTTVPALLPLVGELSVHNEVWPRLSYARR